MVGNCFLFSLSYKMKNKDATFKCKFALFRLLNRRYRSFLLRSHSILEILTPHFYIIHGEELISIKTTKTYIPFLLYKYSIDNEDIQV